MRKSEKLRNANLNEYECNILHDEDFKNELNNYVKNPNIVIEKDESYIKLYEIFEENNNSSFNGVQYFEYDSNINRVTYKIEYYLDKENKSYDTFVVEINSEEITYKVTCKYNVLNAKLKLLVSRLPYMNILLIISKFDKFIKENNINEEDYKIEKVNKTINNISI